MKISLRRAAILVLSVYVLFSCYTAYILIQKRYLSNTKDVEKKDEITDFEGEMLLHHGNSENKNSWRKRVDKIVALEWPHDNDESEKVKVIEIWGKAAIGLYLWEHILEGDLEERSDHGIWQYGEKTIANTIFRFRTGPGVVVSTVPQHVEHLVLVLNGREKSKVSYSKQWLDSLESLPLLRSVAVVLLGNEQCQNDWITPYLHSDGGPVKRVFLVYDSPEIEGSVFHQWPLGVATYRGFPIIPAHSVLISAKRPFRCNFVGTIYPNSSRDRLLHIIQQNSLQGICFTKPRLRWTPEEDEQSRSVFIEAMRQSDLTLSPVGVNTECYRIYEALSLGSVPVVEDSMTPGRCGGQNQHNTQAPLRILKEYNAPVIYIKDWAELPELLHQESLKSQADIQHRRYLVLTWYKTFKQRIKQMFFNVTSEAFFPGIS